jgi:hypothetical protein
MRKKQRTSLQGVSDQPIQQITMETYVRTRLRCLVPVTVASLWLRGGLPENYQEEAYQLGDAIASTGEALLFYDDTPASKKKGIDTESMLVKFVDGTALLSFAPGGVPIYGLHFDSEKIRRDWGIPRPGAEAFEGRSDLPFSPPDPTKAVRIMQALAWVEVRNYWRKGMEVEALLGVSVLGQIRDLQVAGGITEYDEEHVLSFLPDLERRGDDLFVFKKEETTRRFVQISEALAVLAFLPGGVEWLGMRFCTQDKKQKSREDRKGIAS